MECLPIENYLPQKRPFIMVDSIEQADLQNCTTTLLLSSDNIMMRDNLFCEAGILENMAQSCAAHTGYVAIHLRKSDVRIGMVAKIKDLNIYRYPKEGELLRTIVLEKEVYGDISIYETKILIGEEIVSTGEFRVILTDKIAYK